MRNTAIYTQLHAAHSIRVIKIDGADIEQYSQQSIGTINGQYRSLPAIVSSGVAPDDEWVIINLTDSRSGHGLHAVSCSDDYMDGRYVGSVAVLGALDDAQAKIWALRQFGQAYGANSASVVRDVSPQAIKLLLDNPASAEGLAISSSTLRKFEGRVTLTDVIWNGGLLKSPERSVDLIHQMQILDTDSQLLDAMSASDMPMLLNELGAVEPEYDALIVEYGSGDGSGINLLMQRLNTAMHKASIGKVKPINVTTTKPFKRNGVTNVAVLFEFDDGQSVTLVFHNPDSTPGKLTSSDILTSWKIMLNKRDVTAALSPKEGDNVQLPDLAKRILLVVEKNSARFQRANAKKAEDMTALGDAQARVESKKSILAGKLGEIDSLEKAIDGAARQAPVVPKPAVLPGDGEDLTQQEADNWNAGDDTPYNGQYQETNGETINYVITKPLRNTKGILVTADNRKDGVKTRLYRLCGAKSILGRWANAQNGYVISSEQKVEKLMDLLNTGWSASPTGELVDPAVMASEQALIQEFQQLLVSAGWTKNSKSENGFDSSDSRFALNMRNNAPVQVPSYLQILHLPSDTNQILSLPNAGGELNFGAYSKQPEMTAKDLMMFVDTEIQKAEQVLGATKPSLSPDAEFFQSIIDGTIDPLTVDMDHVIELAEKHEGNAEMEVLIDQALEAINQAEQAAAQAV